MVLLQMPRYTRDQCSLVDKTNQKKRWETFRMNGKTEARASALAHLEQQRGNAGKSEGEIPREISWRNPQSILLREGRLVGFYSTR